MKNIIIFAGGFDPIHSGHLNMARFAQKQLDGEVFFEVAPISIWKESLTPVGLKIEMVKLAIKDNPHFHIDTFEANSNKKYNYTIDTVRYFKDKFPDDKLYLLIGTDQINRFHEWRQAEEISSLVQIIYFNRPNYELDSSNVKRFNMIEIKGEVVDTSATEIRSLEKLNLEESTLQYICDHKLYFVQDVAKYLSERRLEHSLSVAMLSYRIAKANGLKELNKAFVAGLLHDVGKHLDDSGELMKKEFPEYCDLAKFSYHQFLGAYLAEKEFKISDADVLSAIKFHATGNANMSELAKIVYAADKIDPLRGYDSSELINAMMENVENGFKTVLKANVEYFEEKQIDYNNRLTYQCIKEYLD